MDTTPDDPKDQDLTNPQVSALTTPDLDGDDIKEIDDAAMGGKTPSEPTAHDFEPLAGEDARTSRDPAEGGDEVPEARPA